MKVLQVRSNNMVWQRNETNPLQQEWVKTFRS